MSGAGGQGAGSTGAGVGTSAGATAHGGTFLRDERTGASLGARRIDPSTRDFEIDSNGRLFGVRDVKQLVHIAVHTEHDSSAVKGFGHRLREIDRITPNFERRVLTVLTDALAPLIRTGLIEVLGFDDFRTGNGRNGLMRGATYGRLRWRDLTTRREHEEIF